MWSGPWTYNRRICAAYATRDPRDSCLRPCSGVTQRQIRHSCTHGGQGPVAPKARITCLSACLALQGAKVGIFCSTPAVELSRAVNTKLAMEMLLTGEPISAEQAQQAGLVNRIVDDASQLDDEVRR